MILRRALNTTRTKMAAQLKEQKELIARHRNQQKELFLERAKSLGIPDELVQTLLILIGNLRIGSYESMPYMRLIEYLIPGKTIEEYGSADIKLVYDRIQADGCAQDGHAFSRLLEKENKSVRGVWAKRGKRSPKESVVSMLDCVMICTLCYN